ncbi:DeoR/GlpR family DNA-binding transcription regulator [Fonticella tunisiensis]|uniref:DeoR family transcriptional regulator n=1 Tax=Fonticella tunisiensis TaxID=1096341 RepID=A0A4R7KV93_9CLOT|nr:DeoR/GlpR family DNA-binding transcription regulator [Fonticella tunisiensis]TDT63684.1 DeoR family transcriptional regulator [Fonticella tunisiensis]
MIIEERHRLIMDTLKKKGTVKISELVELTNTSESTIRRDLTFLESINALKRVHGGATLLKGGFNEPSYNEKLIQNIEEKKLIAGFAASLINHGDSIYLDAGTTTFEMINYIDKNDIVVVTNGLKHIDALIEKGIDAYILGGKVRAKTKAIVGIDAIKSLEKFRFDKAFLGINGVHYEYGYTTPDSDEAILKESAIKLSKESFVLADESKFGEVAFIKVAELDKAAIITNNKVENYEKYSEKTEVKVVTEQ